MFDDPEIRDAYRQAEIDELARDFSTMFRLMEAKRRTWRAATRMAWPAGRIREWAAGHRRRPVIRKVRYKGGVGTIGLVGEDA